MTWIYFAESVTALQLLHIDLKKADASIQFFIGTAASLHMVIGGFLSGASDGSKGRYLAELTVTSEDKKVRIDCQVAWRNLPPSDPVALELEMTIKEGIEETRWIMEQREK